MHYRHDTPIPQARAASRGSARSSRVCAKAIATIGISASATSLVACGGDMPQRDEIISTRVLAMRVDVTEPLFPEAPELATRCEALPGETVRVTPFVVDAKGPIDVTSISPIWLACDARAGLDVFACLRKALPTSLAEIPECPAPQLPPTPDLDEALLPALAGGADDRTRDPTQGLPRADSFAFATRPDAPPPEPQSPCRIPTSETGLADYAIPMTANALFGGSVEITMVGSNPGGTSSPACADALLGGDGKVPDDCLLAVQKVALGPEGLLLLLAQQLGIDLGDIEVPDPADIPDADRNPRMVAFDMREVTELYRGEVIGPTLNVPYGADVGPIPVETFYRLRALARPDDLQSYPIVVNETDSEDKVEYYQAQWFSSWGELSSNNSDDPESFTVWGLLEETPDQPDVPDDGEATLYYVLRDNRGGVDWWWFRFGVTP